MITESTLGFRETLPSDPGPLAAPAISSVLGGKYTLTRLLGAGGMGAVYEAATDSGQRVAIKVLLQQLQGIEDARVRFEREIALTSTLTSEHIVRTLDTGVDKQTGTAFMVMPLMVGMDVAQLLDGFGPLHPTLAVRIVRQACRALSVAHASGVIHRDIKPANLFLDQQADGRVTMRVLDLGIAKWLGAAAELTRTGASMGTPSHMAPEQIADAKRVDVATDVWSLGVTLYEMLAGSQPFAECAQLVDLLTAIAKEDPKTVQDRAPWIDPGLAIIVQGTMIRESALRCPSPVELEKALEPFSGGSDDIHASMYQPLPMQLREHVAHRAQYPASWQMVAPARPAPKITLGDADPLLGRTLDHRYRLLRCLGQGGMGAVYEAELEDHSRVAVKVIRPELAGTSRTARRRFVREANAVKDLNSENVVRVIEVGADPEHDMPFIAMELLTGHDLEQTLQKHGALRPKMVARIFLQASRGLAAAHDRGFIHRDVKPANLFLALQPDGALRVKLCDFGIAKQLSLETSADTTANLTRTGGVVGSPMYMSPEQAKSASDIDGRSDVWSLGAAMYEALSGVPPWNDKSSIGELILAVCSEEVTPIQDRAAWVPASFAEIVHRAMQKDPARRFPSMREMSDALEQLVGSRADIFNDEIKPVTKEARGVPAARAVGTVAPATHAGTTRTVDTPPQRSRFGLVAMVAAVGLTGGGAAYLALGGAKPETPVAESPVAHGNAAPPGSGAPNMASGAPERASARAPAPHTARVRVAPANAAVTVDGRPASISDGAIVVKGTAGDSFKVTVTVGNRSVSKDVVLLGDGMPSPGRVELVLAATPPGSTTRAERTKPTVAPSPPPAATPPPPAGVQGREDW